jgi:hypothetical protein
MRGIDFQKTPGDQSRQGIVESQPREQSSARPKPPLSVLHANGPCRDQALTPVTGAQRGSPSSTTVPQCHPAGQPPPLTEGVEPTFRRRPYVQRMYFEQRALCRRAHRALPLSGARGATRDAVSRANGAVRRVVLVGSAFHSGFLPTSIGAQQVPDGSARQHSSSNQAELVRPAARGSVYRV